MAREWAPGAERARSFLFFWTSVIFKFGNCEEYVEALCVVVEEFRVRQEATARWKSLGLGGRGGWMETAKSMMV
jgi:hypothetical protein